MFTTAPNTKKKGKKEFIPDPVIKFDKTGKTVLPLVNTTDEFNVFRGRTAEAPKASNFKIYFGKYEVPEGKKVPIGFIMQLTPVYGKTKTKKSELPSMIENDDDDSDEEETE